MKMSRAELKMRARRALVGNYVNLILAMLVMVLVSAAISVVGQVILMGSGILGGFLAGIVNGTVFHRHGFSASVNMYVAAWIPGFLAAWATVLFAAGMNRMCISLGREGRTDTSQIWWAFKNHPGRFCLLQLLICLLCSIASLPVIVISAALAVSLGTAAIGGPGFGLVLFLFLFLLVYGLIFAAVFLLLYLNYGLVYYVLADHPDMGVFQGLSETRRIMRGNRLRFLVLHLSFIGWRLLAVLTAGIGGLWINPYARCTFAMFYLEISRPHPDAERDGAGDGRNAE